MYNTNKNQSGRLVDLYLMFYNNMKQKNTLFAFKSKLNHMFDKTICILVYKTFGSNYFTLTC